jgi:hypothetical protein
MRAARLRNQRAHCEASHVQPRPIRYNSGLDAPLASTLLAFVDPGLSGASEPLAGMLRDDRARPSLPWVASYTVRSTSQANRMSLG